MNKYRNTKTVVDGLKFDSKREATRYQELRLLERGKQIERLERQVPYVFAINGVKVCKFIADFQYRTLPSKELVVEDVKSIVTAKTKDFVIKRKLMRAIYNIDVLVTT